VIVNILAFHFFLDAGQGLIMALVLVAVWAFLVWAHRDYYKGLCTKKASIG
jgi:hypothetical protein